MTSTILKAATLAGLCLSSAAQACSSCGCTLTSDWITQGLAGQPGTNIDLRYDYVPQTQLRAGISRVDRGAIALPADREIEDYTYNHYVTLGLDHSWSPDWAVNIQVPFNIRPHRTIAEGDLDASHSYTSGLGDVRATVRYQGFGGTGITGIQLGLKLPTGGFRDAFDSGPALGELLDRGLQNGSGTTDALVGAYRFGNLAGRFDYFLQGQLAVPLNSRSDYRPGVGGTASAGVHYNGWRGITPQLQFNLRVAEKDHGAEADRDNSGGTLLYVSPGGAVALGRHLTGFAFVQLPVYQRVNGFQITPVATATVGLRYRI